jgi:prepilin-type N-terminal cleavage/methylation domain-containing protein
MCNRGHHRIGSISGRNRERETGFSLVELLAVLVVAGVVSALAAPNVARWIENYRVKATARQLVSDFQSVRMKAISQKVDHRLSFDSSNKSYKMEKWNSAASQWNQVGVSRAFASDGNPYFARGVNMSDNFTNHVAAFSTSGSVSSGGTVTLSSDHYSKRVNVTLIGRVSIE